MNGDLALDHVQIAIPVGGEDQARQFFVELLGLTQLAKPADMAERGGCWFQLGDRQLHLGAEQDFRPAKKAHVAIATGALDSLCMALDAAGYEIKSARTFDGRHRFFSHDPFGNRIEFMDRTARG